MSDTVLRGADEAFDAKARPSLDFHKYRESDRKKTPHFCRDQSDGHFAHLPHQITTSILHFTSNSPLCAVHDIS